MNKEKLAYDLALVYAQELLRDRTNDTDEIRDVMASGTLLLNAFEAQYEYLLEALGDVDI